MPRSKRVITNVGLVLQGYAFYALITHSLIWPLIWPSTPFLYATVWILFILGYYVTNGMLTSEFLRKTHLESEQIAAQQIQRTLQPEKLEPIPGYEMEAYYKPFRAVGGDYFDVIGLPGNQLLFAVADVSGKGMAAALFSATIQALVRSIASTGAEPVRMARQINEYLIRYTASGRYATAVLILLDRDTGKLTYVNAGHNAPILFSRGSPLSLDATGIPLGLFARASHEAREAVIQPGDTLLIFTDGLTDAIPADNPERFLHDALAAGSNTETMAQLKALVDPKLNEDDVTILLVKRGMR